MHEDVTRWLHLPRPLRSSTNGARNFEATYSSGPVKKAATPLSRLQLNFVPILPFSYISDDYGSTSTPALQV